MADDDFQVAETPIPAKKATAKKTAAKKATTAEATAQKVPAKKAPAQKVPAKKVPTKATAKKATTAKAPAKTAAKKATGPATGTMLLFQPPDQTKAPVRRARKAAEPAAVETVSDGGDESGEKVGQKRPGQRQRPAKKAAAAPAPAADDAGQTGPTDRSAADDRDDRDDDDSDGEGAGRRRRRRGGRRRRKPGEGDSNDSADSVDEQDNQDRPDSGQDGDPDQDADATSRRRRRRRRAGDEGGEGSDDPQNTVTRVRKQRSAEDEITAISGSTRLEAKKQRRRDGREAGRRRAPIVSEAEFLARRESVERVMVIRQQDDLTQIGVLEDKVLVEHYVSRESQISLIGNVYLGRVQNVLPSMEAAFIDIGKGRNAVLYAGEVNWSALGQGGGGSRKIESVLSSGQSILVQVTKDPIGQKGARLTSQVSLAGRFLVYVPDGTTSGISRKLPDTERSRLKSLLKDIVPDTAGVIVRTAAEGASEDELTRDVERLKARWNDIEAKLQGSAPQLLYGEPDLTLKVVRDLFTEDFAKLVIEGDDAWDTVTNYVNHVAPDLQERVERFERGGSGKDIFATYRVNEQIAKGLDRKVWLPSGGSLVIDRTEAMTVVDVNTGKFTGSGGNLEETVTKNNLEAAEEMVRQLRLRDIGGIIVIDFIDMVLESNRDLVLRRLVECLGRDRTRHQVAEVTSLGLVQMTRKRIGTGLVESFSHNCEHCQGRGVVIEDAPVEPKNSDDDSPRGGRRNRGGRGRGQNDDNQNGNSGKSGPPSPKDVAAMAKHEPVEATQDDEPQTAEATEPAAPKVVTRSRRRSASRPAAAPVTDTDDETEAPESAPESAPEPAAPVAEEPSGPPEPPKVVTRARRRSASRPTSAPTSEPVAVIEVVEPTQKAPASAPEPPKVMTRTRGGSANRPAGPPASEPALADNIEHVPIKKKGTRKR